MAKMAADPHYQRSAHINNAKGVRPSCGDCHIPKTNWFVETYTHVKSGIRDVIATLIRDLDEHRLAELAKEVRENMRAQDNATCKSCHTLTSIRPASQSGQAVHAALREGQKVACIDCHVNLVHPPTAPVAATDEWWKMVKRASDDWAHAPHLAKIHGKQSFACSTCHGNDIVPANTTAIDAQCVNCHGGLEKVALSFKKQGRNPHASHLGNLPCTTCHMGHKESKPICLTCHTNIEMPIPGGAIAEATKP
jgi:NapC/NirT cytochrome c family, N-terminal region/Cytochrome c3